MTEWLTLSTFKQNFHFVPKLEMKLLQCQIISLVRMSPIIWRLPLKAFSGKVDMLEFGLHALSFKMHRLKLVRLTLNVWTCLFYTCHGKYSFILIFRYEAEISFCYFIFVWCFAEISAYTIQIIKFFYFLGKTSNGFRPFNFI